MFYEGKLDVKVGEPSLYKPKNKALLLQSGCSLDHNNPLCSAILAIMHGAVFG